MGICDSKYGIFDSKSSSGENIFQTKIKSISFVFKDLAGKTKICSYKLNQ